MLDRDCAKLCKGKVKFKQLENWNKFWSNNSLGELEIFTLLEPEIPFFDYFKSQPFSILTANSD